MAICRIDRHAMRPTNMYFLENRTGLRIDDKQGLRPRLGCIHAMPHGVDRYVIKTAWWRYGNGRGNRKNDHD